MIQSVYKKELYFTNNKIINYLISKEKQCLVILGSWGCGKTYFWKQIEKEITLNFNNKKVIYIDLFGKESYKQVIEEIVVSLHGNYNNITKKTFKGLEGLIKGASGGLINIDSDVIFSFLKKEDFKKIIVCLDNIERKSDNLPLKEILGLVNLLKEEKECNVVMILNKDGLKKQDDNSDNNKEDKQDTKDWYQEYKEKVIDCEYTIKDNNEIAKDIIIEKLKVQDKALKDDLKNIIFTYYKEHLNNNLRLLLKSLEHINHFNDICFMKFYNKENHDNFIHILKNHYYSNILQAISDYYIPTENIFENTDDMYIITSDYMKNFFTIDKADIEKINYDFTNRLQNLIDKHFHTVYNMLYTYNSNDIECGKTIEDLVKMFLPIKDKYSWDNFKGEFYCERFLQIAYSYKRITNKKLDITDEIIKFFIKSNGNSIPFKSNSNLTSFKRLRTLIAIQPKYAEFYENTRKFHKIDHRKEIIFEYYKEPSLKIFHNSQIDNFNKYKLESIIDCFKNNNQFYMDFIYFFSIPPSNSKANIEYFQDRYDIFDYEEYLKKIKSNNLFRAFNDFINQNEYKFKKKQLIKTTTRYDKNILSELLLTHSTP
ncbi:KAP family NTPase [Campylobacter sp. CNRCH_2015_0814]|uniref:KAP family NTPase n=1 Tax=Campylobacter sp. CNRCH_2015_0814 TaxID=2911606 RepID=UPI0021E68B8A|nr:KAP family NTPase [Campylobacter sp. CNRCH_2015_0814]MCV3469946.1 KAP family NTPase [Campylobacter sp. CNRCH_2015_0814]